MFGGLNVKHDDEGKDSNGGAGPALSAFGFLNAIAPAPAPVESHAPAGSGFSFLNAPAPAPEVSEPPPPATLSGFSFLQETTPPAVAPATESVAAPAESGFSFMIPSPEKAPTVTEPEINPPSQSAPWTTGYSAFNFLSGDSQDEGDTAPIAMRTISVGSASVASSVVSGLSPISSAPSSMLDLPTDASFPSATASISAGPHGLPTGAGVSFGIANKPVVRKKKTRAQKVGMGASPITQTIQPNVPPAPASSPMPRVSPTGQDTRDAAIEAQRRAEEFMSKKTLAEATIPVTMKSAPVRMPVPRYDEVEVGPSASTDEEVARAQRAAEEAQKIAGAGTESRGGFMGTFFKGFGGTTSSTKPGPSPPPGGDNLARQQQEMKWAAAERQTELQRHPALDTDKDREVFEPVETPALSPPSISITQTSFKPAEPATKPGTYVVQEVAPPLKKKKTATQAFEEYQALFAQAVHRAMQQVEAVRNQQKMLTEERFVAIAKQRLSTQQIAQTETQLQLAVDNEDYELADHLGQVVEAHNREMAEVASVLHNIAKALEQLESQKSLVVQGVATCFDNLAVHIKELQEGQNERERHTETETFRQFEVISKQLSAEQERLNQDLKLMERDAQLTLQERKEVESAISDQSGTFEKQRDNAKEQLEIVEEEIVELRRQLEAKSRIAAGLRTEVHGYDDSISKVRVKFSRQLARVEKKEKDLEESRADWETEMTTHKLQKEAHELQVQSHSEALLEHDSLMKTMEKELILCKEFAGRVSTKLGFMQNDTKTKEAEDAETEGNLAQLQADVVKCEAAWSEAKVLAKAATAAIANLESELSMLTARVPELEAEKKAAAGRRDFKAASKASKEIKDAMTRVKECEEELTGEAAEKKKAAEDEFERLFAELDKTRKIAEEGEKVSGMARMEDLAEQIKSLVATKKELCGEASSSENTVKGVGAFVLEGQIKALNDEGQELGSKYGGWNDLVKDILCSDAENEDEVAAQTKAPVDDGLTSEERIAKVRALMTRIEETEPLLEAAVEREDYEEAARLQEILDSALEHAQAALESMNLTEEETQIALGQTEPESMAEVKDAVSGSNDEGDAPTPEAEGDVDAAPPIDNRQEEDASLSRLAGNDLVEESADATLKQETTDSEEKDSEDPEPPQVAEDGKEMGVGPVIEVATVTEVEKAGDGDVVEVHE